MAAKWAFVTVVLLGTISAHANDLRPRVLLTWESRNSDASRMTTLRQEVALFLSRSITETIAVRVGLAANRYGLATHRDGLQVSDSDALEMRPSGSFNGSIGPVRSEGEYALRRSRYSTAGVRHERDDEQLQARAAWTQARFAPGGEARITRSTIDDRTFGSDVTNSSWEASLNYAIAGLSVSGGQSARVDGDSRAGYERSTVDRFAALLFTDTWLDGKLSVTASSNGSVSAVEQSGVRSRIPTFVQAARAYFAIDDTPLDSTDRPPTALQSLIDGRTTVSTGIDLGPQGASFNNITFDIGRISPVGEIRLIVRDDRNEAVLTPDGIRWDVYTSLDGDRWVLHAADAPTRFDGIRSQFDVSFDQVDTRWIKVVTFGVSAQAVFVTEAQLVYFRGIGQGASEAQYRSLISSASVVWSPRERVSFMYNGSTYTTSQDSGSALLSEVSDTSHMLSARHDLTRTFGYEVRYEQLEARTENLRQTASAYGVSARYVPRPELSTSLTCEVREEAANALAIESRYCSTQISAAIFPTLDLTFGASNRTQDAEDGSLQTFSFYGTATARVTRTLRSTLAISSSRNTTSSWTGTFTPPSSDDRVTAEVDWSPGRALGLGGTFGWTRGEFGSGILQRYRVRWNPFGDGALSLTTSYTEDVDPYSNSRSTRWLVSPRWQINSAAALHLTYASMSTTGVQTHQSDSILAALSLGR